ncbi:ABC transporter [Salinarchaeum sp. Harcht-Bsk1]|uniref:ABC transporter ATP-binding protein n=1 Tax=Salinarchaeum sp. Harcht-Bsk1 TaxID=1333523 RepID=UPI000342489B|nr:ABC transporter ATP-binding protein [Salinarchaeum sp. Harcht-Bsk1]AGN01245.1 ABC transporter [Salinarchaeum sp. Harcht-Bsk1]
MSGSRPPAVRLEGISKHFGDVVANDDVNFDLERGSVHALIGENGAGKTTLMKILYGQYTPDAGRIYVDGEERSFESSRDAIDAGIGMIHQHFMLIDTLTVLQNVVLGNEPTDRFGRVDTERARREITEICEEYGFDVDEYLDDRIEDVGVGVQQRVEILKTLYRDADTIVLDEPTAVLTPQEVESLYQVMDELTAQGHSIIFITHKLEEAMRAADEITVLRDGHTVGTVDAEEATQEQLAELMVGREVLFEVEQHEHDVGAEVLDVAGLHVNDDRDIEKVSGLDFTIKEGEIFGIAGVEGNGQRELVEAITGLREASRGTVVYEEADISDLSRRERIEAGIAYVPEDRQEEGIVMNYDLVQNALLGNQTAEVFQNGRFLDWDEVERQAERIVEEYDVEPRNVATRSADLSGGNQQKFIVGREFEHDPTLIVAAHPTRGVDVGSIEFIHDRLLEIRDEGAAVLLVSSKLDEVQKLSDRIGVLYEGEFTDVVEPEAVNEQELGLMMAGQRPGQADADVPTSSSDDAAAGANAAAEGGDP